MTPQAIFALQFVLSIVVWALAARWVLTPWLETKPKRSQLFWLILPHAFRHVGMVFLVPGVVSEDLPLSFAGPAAYGDLAAAALALLALIALRAGWSRAVAVVWVFNVVGVVDLLNALRHADAIPHLGAAWYIPTMLVPLLLVTHVMIFVRLLRGRGAPTT